MDKFIEIKETFDKRIEKGLLHSAILGAFREGQQIFKYNLGCVDRQIFRLASMTKPITAVAFAKCVELGLLSPEEKIEKYLPNFSDRKIGKIVDGKVVYLKDSKTPITFTHILSHSSGLGSGVVGDSQFANIKLPASLKERVELFSTFYLDFEPGKDSFYSGICALDVIARIIEIVSGMDYFEFLRKYVFNPLGMVDTVFKLNEEQKTRLVPMYKMNEDRTSSYHQEFENRYAGFECFPVDYVGGTAGLFSTFEDYSNFARMLANGGEFNGQRILSEESVKLIATPIPLNLEKGTGVCCWGYAVLVRCEEGNNQPLPVGCYGWSGAYAPHFFVEPTRKICVLMMTNMNNDLGSGSLSIAEFERVVAKVFREQKIF